MSFVDGMAWDSKRNRMIAALAGNLLLYSIDLSTASASLLANAGSISDHGMTYDPVADRFWLADFNGTVLQLNPDSFASTPFPTAPGPHTCLAFLP